MNLRKLKLELFYLRKAFFQYKSGFKYIYNKYFFAPRVLKINKPLEKPINNSDLSVHILTCHKDLIMTIWSLASFYSNMDVVGELFIHNDGSLNQNDQNILKKFFPSSQIINPKHLFENHNTELEKYPIIKKFRSELTNYFLLKKLIDPYFVSNKKFHLIIDSDLLWFLSPKDISTNIAEDCRWSLMMKNNNNCYVHFKNGRLDDNLATFNSGIVLYDKINFSLDKLSDYLEKIDTNNKENAHFIEQVGYAYCLNNPVQLAEDLYTIKGSVESKTVVKHYTSPRRPLLFTEGLEFLKSRIL